MPHFVGQVRSIEKHGLKKAKRDFYQCQICSRTCLPGFAYCACQQSTKERLIGNNVGINYTRPGRTYQTYPALPALLRCSVRLLASVVPHSLPV